EREETARRVRAAGARRARGRERERRLPAAALLRALVRAGVADPVLDDREEPGAEALRSAPRAPLAVAPRVEERFLEDVLGGVADAHRLAHPRLDEDEERRGTGALDQAIPVFGRVGEAERVRALSFRISTAHMRVLGRTGRERGLECRTPRAMG